MEPEEWRDVPSEPDMEASSWGRIRRKPYKRTMPHGGQREYVSKPTYGYRVRTTGLHGWRRIYRYRGLQKTFKVHRLVCEAFHGEPPFPGAIVMHLNDDSEHNRPDNLRWATQKDNLNAPQYIEYCKSRKREAA